MEVLETRANTPDLLRFWSITRLILPEALKQLDPERLGMIITVVRCMPPTGDGKIRSLRETIGQGTGPWNGNLEEKALLLGAESLAGYVTTLAVSNRWATSASNRTFLPAYQAEHEISAVACPIMRACRVAGCLLFSSTQPDYFASEIYLELVSAYTRLISLAFDASDFYNPDLIDLHIMPPLEVQLIHISSFRQRVLKLMQRILKWHTTLGKRSGRTNGLATIRGIATEPATLFLLITLHTHASLTYYSDMPMQAPQ